MLRRLLVLAWLCAASGVALAQPSPQQQAKAREHFNRAQAAEKDGRFRDAIDEYEQAYALVPHADVLYNIGFDYEKLEQWAQAADYYQRYLDERAEPPADADAVRRKIRDLRVKVKPMHVEPPSPPPSREAESPPTNVPATNAPPPPVDELPPTPPPGTTAPPPARWHGGLYYGYAFGDAPSERFAARGGVRFAKVVELDAIVGGFGNNDYAAGLMARVVVLPDRGWSPFARGAVTIGYARQDASSTAQTRNPLGFEAGGGVQFGGRGWFELDAVVRWLRGGWDAASTTADSYINDSVAFGIDLGFSFDIPIMATGR